MTRDPRDPVDKPRDAADSPRDAAAPSGPPALRLRRRAEDSLRDSASDLHLPDGAPDALIHELRVHEVELELQNDELRRTQHELACSRDEYRDLFEHAPVGLVTLDRHGLIIEGNRAAGVLLGQGDTPLAGQPLSRFVAAADAARWALHLRNVLAGPCPQRCELRLQRREGEPFPVQLVSVALASGVRRCRTAIIDLADLRRAEQEQRDLAAIVEASGDAIFSASLDGAILSWNPAAAALFGYSAAETLGQSLGLLAPTGQEGSQYLQWDRVWNGERNLRQQSTCRHKDGRLVQVSLAIAPVVDRLRGTTRIAIVARDIGEQLEREGVLRRLATVVTDSYDAITVQDLEGRILSWNYGAERMYGYSEREARKLTVFELTPAGAREDLRAVYARLRHAREAGVVESQRVTADGRVIDVLLTASLLFDEKGQPNAIATTERDVSERKRLEAKLRQSQKMEALGRLASGVAHDFNNFLMGIIGCAELAARDLGDRPARRYVDEIRRAAQRSASVVSQLLSFGRKRPLAPSVFELDRAISEASTMISTLLRDDIALSFDLDTAPLHVCCDRGELERALLNLVVNAREAMPGGGAVKIQTRRLSPAAEGPPPRAIDGSAAPERIVLSVIDDGCGMDPETKSRAFEPFFSGKPENTGLGLAMVYGLIQQSDGQIEIESEQGHGTTITISLPVAEPTALAVPAGEERDRLAGRPAVLVVEDDPLVRLTLRSHLESSGCELFEAADSTAALACCEHRLEALDLLITDVVLPGLSGPQLARELRARRPDLPVIYISAYAPETLRQENRIDPGESALQKPFERAELLATIRRALGDH